MNETVLRETQSAHDAYCNSDDDQDDRDETATEPRIASFHDSLCAFRKYVIHRPVALILPRWQPLNRPP